MGQRLGNQDTALHAARQHHDFAVFFIVQGQLFKDVLKICIIAWLAEQPSRKPHRVHHCLKRFEVNFLRNKADKIARAAKVGLRVETTDNDGARGRNSDTANGRNQRCFARAVWPQQRQYLTFFNFQIDAFECFKPVSISLAQ